MDALGTYVVVPFISGFFNVLLDRLATEKMRNLLMGRDSTFRMLLKLKRSMKVVGRVVNDAENKQDADPDVKDWLDSVKHAVYDAEDLIDEIYMKALHQRTESETQSGYGVAQVFGRITANLGSIAHSLDLFYEGIESRIDDMNKVFEEFIELIDVLGLEACPETSQHLLPKRSQTTPSVDESTIYGRDSEREQIMNILQDDVLKAYPQDVGTSRKTFISYTAPIPKTIKVITIVGMPGIGKTTLAQLIFNDPRVGQIFDLKAWICVPKGFDILEITKSILKSLLFLLPHVGAADNDRELLQRILYVYNGGSAKDLEICQEILRKRMAGRKFLIVLDDVWDEDFDTSWEALCLSLQSAAAGSTIIVTTRNRDIARKFHPIFTLELQELSAYDCWSLIRSRALADPHAGLDGSLDETGRRIAAKCRGLPLAAKALGGLLAGISDSRKWEDIENSRIWDLAPSRKEILPALLLSYNFLPPHLRRCFAYCSIFPKNYQFQKENLLMLWMAEGIIDPATSYNHVARDSFDDLFARSFFQESSSNKHYFVMHDLIHELAIHVMGEFGLMLEAKTSSVVFGRPRHFTYKQCLYDTIDRFYPIAHPDISQTLRTFLPVRTSPKGPLYLSGKMLQSLMLSFGCLRVLSLCGYNITSIPPSIANLKLLCYLDFSSTLIEGLPETICGLYNLQTLLLSNCQRLKSLPSKIGDLIRMCHLDIHGTNMLEEMPEGIGKLSSLQMLTDFVVGRNQGARIGELGDLKDLKGHLRISGLENVVAEADAKAAKLIEKTHLDGLILEQGQGSSVADGQNERLLQELKPHKNLTRLSIVNYNGERLPCWLGHADFEYLEVLHLCQCQHCIELPTLGQLPKLKHVIVEGFDQLQIVDSNFYGQLHSSSIGCFKSLVSLKFLRLLHWKEWSTIEADVSYFPSLQELYIWDCPELSRGFPLQLPALKILNMRNCPEFSGSLPQSPFLRELSLTDCGRADLRSLAELTCLTSLSLQWIRPRDDHIAVVKVAIPHLTSLNSLTLNWSDLATAVLKVPFPRLTSLNSLSSNWSDLATVSDELSANFSIPSSVRSLDITGIHETGLQLEDDCTLQYLHISNSASRNLRFQLDNSQMLNYLRILGFYGLNNIEIIPGGDRLVLRSLYDLSIERCPRLSIFPAEGFLADNLTTLSIHDCGALGLLGDTLQHCFPSLRFLSVEDCPRLESLRSLPLGLQTLRLWRCENLRNLPLVSRCTSLELLDIAKCPKLVSVCATDLPYSLHKLKISECEKLESLPDDMCSTLVCLNLLHVSDCPELESFPPGGLPPNLEVLHVRNCRKLILNNVGWQLHRLIYLRELVIEGYEGEDPFPANGSLPSALTILSMVAFPNLSSINCTELKCLSCIRELEVRRCRSLRKFPLDLPQSLCRLAILECPVLLAKLQGTDLLDFSDISQVPCLVFDQVSC